MKTGLTAATTRRILFVSTFLIYCMMACGQSSGRDREKNTLIFLSALLTKPHGTYAVQQVQINPNHVEHRMLCEQHHFMTLVDNNGTMNIRPHPGVDINGWGSSWYAQPFLPGAVLRHTVIHSLQPAGSAGIHLNASGGVSQGTASTYGTWSMDMHFSYNPRVKKISGTGTYTITLEGPLSQTGGDLNLYRVASNYLHQVPLLNGRYGDTGDMLQAEIQHGTGDTPFGFSPWLPPAEPEFFPSEETTRLTINIVGQCNNVDTARQGYAPIDAAFKPSMKITLAADNQNVGMRFGAMYDLNKSKDFWEDNVGITPLINQNATTTSFTFAVQFESTALPGDGGTPCP